MKVKFFNNSQCRRSSSEKLLVSGKLRDRIDPFGAKNRILARRVASDLGRKETVRAVRTRLRARQFLFIYVSAILGGEYFDSAERIKYERPPDNTPLGLTLWVSWM